MYSSKMFIEELNDFNNNNKNSDQIQNNTLMNNNQNRFRVKRNYNKMLSSH